MKVDETGKYRNLLREIVRLNPDLVNEVYEAVNYFKNNPSDSRLKTHALRKRMKGKFAFSVNNDIRIIFSYEGKNRVKFLAIGTHKQVYGKRK